MQILEAYSIAAESALTLSPFIAGAVVLGALILACSVRTDTIAKIARSVQYLSESRGWRATMRRAYGFRSDSGTIFDSLPYAYQSASQSLASALQSARSALRCYDRGHALQAIRYVRCDDYSSALSHALAALPWTGGYVYCRERVAALQVGSSRADLVQVATYGAATALAIAVATSGAGAVPTLVAAGATIALPRRVWDRMRSGLSIADDDRRRRFERAFEADDLEDPESGQGVSVDAREESSEGAD